MTQIVLPLLQGGECRRPRVDLAHELEDWLAQFEGDLCLCADSDWDWMVLRQAITGVINRSDTSGPLQIGKRTVTLLPVNIPNGAAGDAYGVAELEYWLRHPEERRHHALSDARALRYFHLAAVNPSNPFGVGTR